MEHPDWLDEMFGYLGSSLLIISLIPQIYHSFSTQKLDDLSAWTLGIELTTSVMFLTYGIIIDEIPMIFGNSGVIIELLILCFAKWKYRPRGNRFDNNFDNTFRYQNSNSSIPRIVFEEDVENNVNENLYNDPNDNHYELQNIRRRHSSSGSNNENSWMSFKNIFNPMAETKI